MRVDWKTIDDPRLPERLLGLEPVTVWVLVRGRNAWNATWVRHYAKNAEVFVSLDDAKETAERQRGPGNIFYIYECPALYLRGLWTQVAVVDVHPENSFGRYRGHMIDDQLPVLRPGALLGDVLRSFGHKSREWVGPPRSEHSVRATSTWSKPPPLKHRFTAIESKSVGSRFLLNWKAIEVKRSARGVLAISKSWNAMLEEWPEFTVALSRYTELSPAARGTTATVDKQVLQTQSLEALNRLLAVSEEAADSLVAQDRRRSNA